MKPGVTTAPSASITRFAASVTRPIRAIRPPEIATSAEKPGIPLPSITRPPRITRSNAMERASQ